MNKEKIELEAARFFEWPTADKSTVSFVSCLLFAQHILNKDRHGRDKPRRGANDTNARSA